MIGLWQHADILPFAAPGDIADSGDSYKECVQRNTLAQCKSEASARLQGAEGWITKTVVYER